MRKIVISLLVAVGGLVGGSAANASYVAIISDYGGGVAERGRGTLDVTDLVVVNSQPFVGSQVDPSAGFIVSGVAGTIETIFEGDITGPSSFGSGSLAAADLESGDVAGISGSFKYLFVPFGDSGEGGNLGGNSVYVGATLASLGLTRGTYVWSWGSGRPRRHIHS